MIVLGKFFPCLLLPSTRFSLTFLSSTLLSCLALFLPCTYDLFLFISTFLRLHLTLKSNKRPCGMAFVQRTIAQRLFVVRTFVLRAFAVCSFILHDFVVRFFVGTLMSACFSLVHFCWQSPFRNLNK